ncbi:hypothetical protein DSO57_1003808 [Entomophthora muscae]|uniref:Uncharacterized protein n=1 Tax=Entomophthora muscae TaxID=34485 RepID=A0ACC2UI46_9FUNG|nr:hypothetical protein DSO57_1003808 [Entomophthora muscae]
MDSYKNSNLRIAIDGFYSRFQELKADIESLISEEKVGLDLDERRTKFDEAFKKIVALREEFKAALVYLPAYDQKSYQEGIKEIERNYNLGLQRLQPAPKFSFKKRGLLNKPTKITSAEESLSCSLPTQTNVATLSSTSELKDDSIRISSHTCKVLELEGYLSTSDGSVSKSVQLSKLEGCAINLFSQKQAIATLYLDDLVNCIVFAPPISNSVLINNCRGCLFFLACHQVVN